MDVTRELIEIRKNYRRYHRDVGEAIIWYEFTPFSTAASSGSIYDDVYDEAPLGNGGRRYKPGKTVPVLMVTESEDTKRAIPEGRQPVQLVNFVASVEDFRGAGVSNVWEYQNHLNDLFQYDGRYFSVVTYRVRGRARDDVMVVVEGIEVYIQQEMMNDSDIGGYFIPEFPWPARLPVIG
jgi:hypothetical protein